jgi:YrbI family 3-deoxy-D-manno-octulosonate 8-phosphate phosphatase
MKKIAIIPLRKGSKGIIGKNKKKLFGRPLYQWVLTEAIFSELDKVFIYTDDTEIIEQINNEYFWTDKVEAKERSQESATDMASTEDAMVEFATKINHDFDILTLLQATSPLTSRNDINKCLGEIINKKYDSALTVVKTKRFVWSKEGESLNYDYLKRPRRQDFNGLFIENGAVYSINKEYFLKSNNRLGGKISTVEMSEDTLFEIDEIEDWLIVEKLIQHRLNSYKKRASKIKAMVFDVDGVFTDGTVGVSNDGELFKRFSLRDGMGFELLKESGITPIVMTSEDSNIVCSRMDKLKLKETYLGVKDKFSRIEAVMNKLQLTRNEVAYVGDDINDLPNIASMGWGICPADAIETIKQNADIVTSFKGGDKSIREAIEFIININKRY